MAAMNEDLWQFDSLEGRGNRMWTAVYDESAAPCTMWRPAWTHPRVASGGVGESRCLGGEIHCPGDPIGLPIRAWARSVAAGWPVVDSEVWVLPRPDGPGSLVLRADGRPLSQNDPAGAVISARRVRKVYTSRIVLWPSMSHGLRGLIRCAPLLPLANWLPPPGAAGSSLVRRTRSPSIILSNAFAADPALTTARNW